MSTERLVQIQSRSSIAIRRTEAVSKVEGTLTGVPFFIGGEFGKPGVNQGAGGVFGQAPEIT